MDIRAYIMISAFYAIFVLGLFLIAMIGMKWEVDLIHFILMACFCVIPLACVFQAYEEGRRDQKEFFKKNYMYFKK